MSAPPTSVPYMDLPSEYALLREEILAAIDSVCERAAFASGPEVERFEQEFAAHLGASHAAGVSSGTSALHLALLAAGVGPGDEVVTVPMTFVATLAAILYTGARPVLVDIDPRTYTLDPSLLEAALGPRTRAVLPVHLYGRCADMDPILEVTRAHGALVIEDAAQAHAARYRDRSAGTLGDLACFSFYPGKNLGAYGEGGMVTCADPALDAEVRLLRDWGAAGRNEHVRVGFNYRMDGIQAAVLRVKLRHLEAWTARRRALAARYRAGLEGSAARAPADPDAGRHVYHVYAVRVPERDRVLAGLRERGIDARVHYPVPVHLQPGYAGLGHAAGDFPQAEALAREQISLPLYPGMSDEQADRVVAALRESLERAGHG